MSEIPLDDYRRFYAEEVAAVAHLRSRALVDALARVPRETFLGPGPWKVFRAEGIPGATGTYLDTPDADPRRLYHNLIVALDAARMINNGQPSLLASWIDALDFQPAAHAVHIGCGAGYYSALMADMVGPSGHVTAIEADPALASRASQALAEWRTAIVIAGDAVHTEFDAADAILVNAGVSVLPAAWFDRVRDNGRILFPLTFSAAPEAIGTGVSVLATRRGDVFDARIIGTTQIYPCTSARDAAGNTAVQRALMTGRWREVQTLRRDAHEKTDTCWCHLDSGCLSTAAR